MCPVAIHTEGLPGKMTQGLGFALDVPAAREGRTQRRRRRRKKGKSAGMDAPSLWKLGEGPGCTTTLSGFDYPRTFPQSKVPNNKLKSDETGHVLSLAPDSPQVFSEHRLLFLPGERGWDQEGEAAGRAGWLGTPRTPRDPPGWPSSAGTRLRCESRPSQCSAHRTMRLEGGVSVPSQNNQQERRWETFSPLWRTHSAGPFASVT